MKKFSELVAGILRPPKTLADIDPGVSSVLDEAVADYRSSQRGIDKVVVDRCIEAGKATVAKLLAKCESPIEKLIVPSLVFQPYGSNGPWLPVEIVSDIADNLSAVGIEAQAELYDARFDFLLWVRMPVGKTFMLAVECDGKEFHNSDKDWYRDRNWNRAGLPTIRLTGSDINKAPRMAASRVAERVLQEMIRRGLA